MPALIFGCLTVGVALAAIAINVRLEAHAFLARVFCDGQIGFSTSTMFGVPAGQSTELRVYCTDLAGVRRNITNLVLVLAAPLFYSAVAAAVLVPLWSSARRRRSQS